MFSGIVTLTRFSQGPLRTRAESGSQDADTDDSVKETPSFAYTGNAVFSEAFHVGKVMGIALLSESALKPIICVDGIEHRTWETMKDCEPSRIEQIIIKSDVTKKVLESIISPYGNIVSTAHRDKLLFEDVVSYASRNSFDACPLMRVVLTVVGVGLFYLEGFVAVHNVFFPKIKEVLQDQSCYGWRSEEERHKLAKFIALKIRYDDSKQKSEKELKALRVAWDVYIRLFV